MKTNKASPCRETNPADFLNLEERESTRKRFFFAFTGLTIRHSSLTLTPWKNEACLAQILFFRGRHLRGQIYKATYFQVRVDHFSLLICNTRNDSWTERPLLNRRLRVHIRKQEPRHQVPVVQNVDSPINPINHYIQRISIRETNSAVQWIEIYSVGRAVQLLDNWGQMFKLLF